MDADGQVVHARDQVEGNRRVIPIVDFNGDEFVDTDDLLIMINNWGSNKPLCDIGPMPWGNGVVDIEDLEVFIEYWEQENMPENPQDDE